MPVSEQVKVPVWDLPIRLFHWLLVISLLGSFVTISQGWILAHFYFGYTLTGLILFRLLWGLLGTTYARFSAFNLSAAGFFRQLQAMFKGSAQPWLGHNPAGGIMVLIMLGTIGLQAVSGLFYSDEVFWFGPFYFVAPDWTLATAAWLHSRLPLVILLLVLMHILAVLYHRFRMREHLIGAMVHGYKQSADQAGARTAINPGWLTLSLLLAAGWLVFLWWQPI